MRRAGEGKMKRRLDNKIVLVTGGASGIGAACAERLAAEGATVVIGDLEVEGLDPSALRMDVADPAAVASAIGVVVKRHGRLDCLVHSAGVARTMPFLDTPLSEFDRIMGINLRGTFIICQAAARVMLESGSGSIVNIGSVSGMLGNGRRSAYGTSKAAMIHLSKVIAVELAKSGIRVNVVSPGPIDTPLVNAFYSDAIREEWCDRVPMGRFGAPAEIASVAAFLCSDDASYITGHVLAVDGGFAIAGLRDDEG